MAGWLDGWMDGWMAGWMDGWMDGCVCICFLLNDSSPAEPLSWFKITSAFLFGRGLGRGLESCKVRLSIVLCCFSFVGVP